MAQRARLDDFDHLTPPEKVLRLQDLWDELSADEAAIALTDSQRQELDRRRDSLSADPNRGTPWTDVRDRLRKK